MPVKETKKQNKNNWLNIIPVNETKQMTGWSSYLWTKQSKHLGEHHTSEWSKQLAGHHTCEWNKANNWLTITPVNETKQMTGWFTELLLHGCKICAWSCFLLCFNSYPALTDDTDKTQEYVQCSHGTKLGNSISSHTHSCLQVAGISFCKDSFPTSIWMLSGTQINLRRFLAPGKLLAWGVGSAQR